MFWLTECVLTLICVRRSERALYKATAEAQNFVHALLRMAGNLGVRLQLAHAEDGRWLVGAHVRPAATPLPFAPLWSAAGAAEGTPLPVLAPMHLDCVHGAVLAGEPMLSVAVQEALRGLQQWLHTVDPTFEGTVLLTFTPNFGIVVRCKASSFHSRSPRHPVRMSVPTSALERIDASWSAEAMVALCTAAAEPVAYALLGVALPGPIALVPARVELLRLRHPAPPNSEHRSWLIRGTSALPTPMLLCSKANFQTKY